MSKKLVFEAFNEIREFASRKLVQNLSECEALRVNERIQKLFEHSVYDGQCRRGELLVDSSRALSKRFKEFNMEPILSAAACLELMHSSFLVHDDIMDGGTTRRGRPCWHTLPGIGLSAINDALILDCIVPLTLRSKRAPFNVKDAFDEARRVTVIGQLLDENTRGIQDCTWTRHREIVMHKTSHYTFYTPIQIAALFTGQPFILPKVKQIAYRLGYLFQCHDDFLDCFGDESQTGKAGTDLREGKCTWITCKAVEKLAANPSLMVEFQAHFGNANPANGTELLKMLTHLGLREDFDEFCAVYSDDLIDEIDHFPMVDLRAVLRQLLNALTATFNAKIASNVKCHA